jgi:plasmid maintenance system antidote protein VapI
LFSLHAGTPSFALEFTSKQDKVTIPHAPVLKVSAGLTAECWVNLQSDCTGYLIAKKQSFAIAVKKKSEIMIALNNVKPGWVWKSTKHQLDHQV